MGVAREAKKEEKAADGDELRDGGPQQDGGAARHEPNPRPRPRHRTRGLGPTGGRPPPDRRGHWAVPDGGDFDTRRFENGLEDSRGAGGDFVGLVGSRDGDWRAVRRERDPHTCFYVRGTYKPPAPLLHHPTVASNKQRKYMTILSIGPLSRWSCSAHSHAAAQKEREGGQEN